MDVVETEGVVRGPRRALRFGGYNQKLVLQLIRLGDGPSRSEIADATGLTGAAVSKIVGRFLAQGLVREEERRPRRPKSGRRHSGLRVEPTAAYALGAHIERDSVSCVLIDLTGLVVGERSADITADRGPEPVVERIGEMVESLVASADVPDKAILGLGVSVPGPLLLPDGVVLHPGGMRGWGDVPLAALLASRTGREIYVGEDAVAAALGEEWLGTMGDARDILYIYVGAGLGAAMILDGRVHHGSHGLAGALFHVSIDADGAPCTCGGRGCVGLYTGSYAALELVARHPRGRAHESYRALCQAALDGSSAERDVLTAAGEALAVAVAGAVHLLDPELVILGGPALELSSSFYDEPVRTALATRLMRAGSRPTQLRSSAAHVDMGAVGASSLVLHAAFRPDVPSL